MSNYCIGLPYSATHFNTVKLTLYNIISLQVISFQIYENTCKTGYDRACSTIYIEPELGLFSAFTRARSQFGVPKTKVMKI